MIYANPGSVGAIVNFNSRYENFISGKWVAPVKEAVLYQHHTRYWRGYL